MVATEAPAHELAEPVGTPAKPARDFIKPVREVGSFFALSFDILVEMVHPPFAWREFINQSWFVARVSIVPTICLSIPFNAFVIFILNILLIEIGAADLSGTGAALGVIVYTGPLGTVLVIAGTGATAMCADLGARTIREEIDALRVMGIDPVRALLAPRVPALALNGLLLNAINSIVGLVSTYVFAVYLQHVTPGAFASSLTLLVGLPETTIAFAKATLFGGIAGFIACYKGITVGGGPQGVGNAVNETVVYTFMTLFVINIPLVAIGAKVGL